MATARQGRNIAVSHRLKNDPRRTMSTERRTSSPGARSSSTGGLRYHHCRARRRWRPDSQLSSREPRGIRVPAFFPSRETTKAPSFWLPNQGRGVVRMNVASSGITFTCVYPARLLSAFPPPERLQSCLPSHTNIGSARESDEGTGFGSATGGRPTGCGCPRRPRWSASSGLAAARLADQAGLVRSTRPSARAPRRALSAWSPA